MVVVVMMKRRIIGEECEMLDDCSVHYQSDRTPVIIIITLTRRSRLFLNNSQISFH